MVPRFVPFPFFRYGYPPGIQRMVHGSEGSQRMEFEQLAAEYSNMIHSIIHSLRIYKNHDEFYHAG